MALPQPDQDTFTIETARPGEAPLVSALAQEIWNRHYPGIISQAQIDYMLDQRYAPLPLTKRLERPGTRLLIARLRGQPVGFALLAPSNDTPDEMALHAIYLHPDHHGKGHGRRFMKHLIAYARQQHSRAMVLNVNRLNIKAINFYFRSGFSIRSVVDLQLGRGFVANDFIMTHDLAE